MKLLLLTSKNDRTTNDVLDWLYYYDNIIDIDRINEHLILANFSISLTKNNCAIKIDNRELNEYASFWYRRGSILTFPYDALKNVDIIKANKNEIMFIPPFLNYFLKNNFNGINSPYDNYTNKLLNLHIANKLKINIPDTLVCDNLNSLKQFTKNNKKYITKSFFSTHIKTKYKKYFLDLVSGTFLINLKKVQSSHNEHFVPSLFQEYIDKKYEIRSFYLNGNFKSMAIFSQQNEQTKIDFRNYDEARPNRFVPYILPKALEKKLDSFMKKVGLNSGSFDLIFTTSGKYYFLEVNPIGQFQWLSDECNYFIERDIAKTILNGK